jgi:hypothetical protein
MFTDKLRSMVVVVGVLVIGGIGFRLATPQPSTRTMNELKDAGITDGQKFVLTCPERLTPQTKRRINDAQPGLLRPKQTYARIARTAVCFNPDAGICFRNPDGVPRTADLIGEVIVPSLRQNVVGADLDAGGEDSVDDSLQFRLDDCEVTTCGTFDAGDGSNFCGRLNRLMAVTAPCAIPLCLGSDGGWDDNAVVDCRATGPFGEQDGGARWRGCNSTPSQYTTGAACVPVECGVLAGDDLVEEWR